ncbi:MAG: FtsX-like permease family protein [Bacteroidales bacterium]
MKKYFNMTMRGITFYWKHYLSAIICFSISITGFIYFSFAFEYDQYVSKNYKDYENTYLLKSDLPNMKDLNEKTSFITTPSIKDRLKSYPEIVNVIRIQDEYGNTKISANSNSYFDTKIIYSDTNFIKLFNYKYVGDIKNSLDDRSKVTITKELSLKLFNEVNSIGKEISVSIASQVKIYSIGAIITDGIEESSINFDILLPVIPEKDFGGLTILTINNKSNPDIILSKLNSDRNISNPFCPDCKFYLSPVAKMYFDNSETQTTFKFLKKKNYYDNYILLFVSIFVLISGFINFFNILVTIHYRKAKSSYIKIFSGASNRDIFSEVFIELLMLFIISSIFSCIIIELLYPFLNKLITTSLRFDILLGSSQFIRYFLSGFILLFILCFLVILVQSAKATINKGKYKFSMNFNRIMLFLQFAISTVLLIYSICIFKQIKYINSKNEISTNLIEVAYDANDTITNFDIIRDEIDKMPFVASSILSSTGLLNGNLNFDNNGNTIISYSFYGDILETLQLKLIDGNTISSAVTNEVYANQEFVDLYKLNDPIGKSVVLGNDTLDIRGIIQPFHTESFLTKIKPSLISQSSNSKQMKYMQISLINGDKKNMLSQINNEILKLINDGNFKIYYLSDRYSEIHKSYNSLLLKNFTFLVLSIILVIIGLYGYSSLSIELRQKEIGIRKIIGANQLNILYLINMEYVKIYFASTLMSIPASLVIIHYWLNNFYYKINFGIPQVFLISLVFIASECLAISYFTFNATTKNPIDIVK